MWYGVMFHHMFDMLWFLWVRAARLYIKKTWSVFSKLVLLYRVLGMSVMRSVKGSNRVLDSGS